MFLCKIDRELIQVARRDTKSVLRDRGYPGLSSFTFEEIVAEMRILCPSVFTILSTMIQLDLNQDKNTAPLALIYGVIMFKRFHELSRVQRLNTVLLYSGNASKEVSIFLSSPEAHVKLCTFTVNVKKGRDASWVQIEDFSITSCFYGRQSIFLPTQASLWVACTQPHSHGPLLGFRQIGFSAPPSKTIRVSHHVVYIIPFPFPPM